MNEKQGRFTENSECSAAYDLEINLRASCRIGMRHDEEPSGAAWMKDVAYSSQVTNVLECEFPLTWCTATSLNEGPVLFIRFPKNYPFQSPDVSVNLSGEKTVAACELLYWTPACTVLDIITAVGRYLNMIKIK